VRRVLAVVVTLACLAVAACGDDDSGPSSTLGAITPVGTKEPTEQASDGAASPGSEAPSPVQPELDEELTLFLDGLIATDILPGDSYEVDPVALGQQVGTPPSCDNFQFDFSWQVTDPYPPDGVAFKWQLVRDGGPVDIASAPAGNQAIGCGVLLGVNEGATPITIAVHYLIGGR